MIAPPPNYRRAFWSSRSHVWLGLATLGLGFASGEPLGLLVGAVLYALGWVFLPDTATFRRSIDERLAASRAQAEGAELAAFQQQQTALREGLSNARRIRYQQLVKVCQDIEQATAETSDRATPDLDTRRRKLEELTWTYLRMLSVEQSLEVYLETERKEQVPASVQALEAETHTLAVEVDALKKTTPVPAIAEGKQRLLTSRLERLAALQQRLQRIDQATTNHELLLSEQARLVEQVKLIRADAIASKNTETLTARIDLSIEHLAATNQWLAELAEFKDLTAQLPSRPSAYPAAGSSTAAHTSPAVRENPPQTGS